MPLLTELVFSPAQPCYKDDAPLGLNRGWREFTPTPPLQS